MEPLPEHMVQDINDFHRVPERTVLNKGLAAFAAEATGASAAVADHTAATTTTGGRSGDPRAQIAEMARRKAAAAEPGPRTDLPAEAAAAAGLRWLESHPGYAAVQFANEAFVTVCSKPNVRICGLFSAKSLSPEDMAEANARAVAFQRKCHAHPDVNASVQIIQCNVPTPIPYSEALSQDPKRVASHVGRVYARHLEYVRYRNEEFANRVENKVQGETGKSEYHRRKEYLAKQRGETVIPTSFAGAGSGAAAAAPSPLVDVSGSSSTLGVTTSTPLPTVEVILTDARPPALAVADLDPRWQQARKEGDDWPAELTSSTLQHLPIIFMEDTDTPEDDPAYAFAAGKEPLITVLNAPATTKEQGSKIIEDEIVPWCKDLPVFLVGPYGWLWPTEVDFDALEEKHRTPYAGYGKEQEVIMTSRKNQLKLAASARQYARDQGVTLPELNANAAAPDIDDPAAMAAQKPGMSLAGVQQFDEHGKLIHSKGVVVADPDAFAASGSDTPANVYYAPPIPEV